MDSIDGNTLAQSASIDRRTIVAGAAGIAVLSVLGGVGRAFAGESDLLRPPGGQDEASLIAVCLKCDRCRSVCPQSCIGIAALSDGLLNARTPRMDYARGFCDFCGKCAEVCPTGAISAGFDETSESIGIAVIDRDECLAYNGGGCQKCVDKCPYEAIAWHDSTPVVVADACNGCGACVFACPSSSMRAFSGSRARRGINVLPEGKVY